MKIFLIIAGKETGKFICYNFLFSYFHPHHLWLSHSTLYKFKSMAIKNILLVDDDAEDSEFFATVVQRMDPAIRVTVASNKEELFHHLQQDKPGIVFIDSFLKTNQAIKASRK